jgi:hypothetical protein
MADLDLIIVGDSRQIEFLVPGNQLFVVELKGSLLGGCQVKAQRFGTV